MPSSAVLTFTDPYAFQTAVRGSSVEVVVTGRGDYSAELTRIDFNRLLLKGGSQSLAYIAHIVMDKGLSAIFFPTETRQAPFHLGGLEVSPGDIVFGGSGAERYHRAQAGCHWGSISLSPDDLSEAGRALVGRDLPASSVAHLIRPRPQLVSRLLNLHKASAELAATVPDLLAHPKVAKAMEQELVRAMVACIADPAAGERGSSDRHCTMVMRRFEQVLQANMDQPLYVAELCAQLGVPDRTLRAQCREHLGMSPHRYLWLRRMHMARRALASADATAKGVTEIALDYGFWELGRFAVAYRKLFGELPSVTLRRPPDNQVISGELISEFPVVQRKARAVSAMSRSRRERSDGNGFRPAASVHM